MSDVKREMLALSDYAFERLMKRLDGLTDEEYFWEPAPDAWSVRRDADGKFRGDWGVLFDEVPPVTTIAWRLCHIIDCLAAERCATVLGLEVTEDLSAEGRKHGLPGTADDVRRVLDRANGIWRGYVVATDEDGLFDAMGPVAGMWADDSSASFILHIIDELIHHGAEVSLLRDLYRASQPQDPFVDAALHADNGSIEALRRDDPDVVERAISSDPDLIVRAAATGRWDAVRLLLDLGFPANGSTGRGPLHHAAGDNSIEMIQLLVDRGADLHAKDPVYQSTPLEWAEYFNRTEAADYLRPLTEGVTAS